MEEWEALDVDDSDLPSLIRPSSPLLPHKRPSPVRQQHHNSNKTNFSHTISLSLEPCSQLPRLSQSQSNTHKPPETLISQPEKPPLPPVVEEPPSTTASQRRIPGPAGAIQAVMHRRTSTDRNFSSSEDRIPTQEFLWRVQEDGDDDEDFKRNSWLCAMDYLRQEANDVSRKIPLSSIKTCLGSERVPQVVAVIKSCTPNGLGDLNVTLKDPSGTIGASIHRKVITDSEFGKDMSVGSVVILQQVAVFSPSRSAQYLNITLRNVVQVIGKDCGPRSKQKHPTFTVRGASSGKYRDIRPERADKAFAVRRGVAEERTTNETVRRFANNKGLERDDGQLAKSAPAARSFHCSNGSSMSVPPAAEKEPLLVRQEVAMKVAITSDVPHEEATLDHNDRHRRDEGGALGSFDSNSSGDQPVKDPNACETWRTSGIKKQIRQLIPKASLPQWTDEQLDELCADDDSLF